MGAQRGVPLGYLSFVLHAHLPFVRHPEHEDFLEEDWLYEAITETYIPLLWVMEGLVDDGIDFRLTLSLTPPLVSMLNDELLRRRYAAHLDLLCELAEKEVERTRHLPQFHDTAVMYRKRFFAARSDYTQRWKMDLVGAFARLQRAGKLEIITCAATHGFLPVLCVNPAAVRAQILVGAQYYTDVFGCAAARHLVAGVRFLSGSGRRGTRGRSAVFLRGHARRSITPPAERATARTPRSTARAALRPLPVIMNRPNKSGARSKATPATSTTGSSIATWDSISI